MLQKFEEDILTRFNISNQNRRTITPLNRMIEVNYRRSVFGSGDTSNYFWDCFVFKFMSDIQAYIASGIIESYLLGFTSEEESQEFESMLLQYPEIQEEVAVVSESLETIARTHEIQPDPTVKPFLMATVDFIKRMEGGETPSFPPILNENSSI